MRWEEKPLRDLFSIGSSKRVLKSQWQTSGVPFYRGREVTKLSAHGAVGNELFISEELFAEFRKKHGVPKAGDIVITAIGTIGNAYVVKNCDRFYFKDASVLWLAKKLDVESNFVYYWMLSPLFRSQLDEANGATVDTLTISKLKSVRIRLPPLAEQRRIVAILDEAFAGIAMAVANTEKNLANACELFESYLQAIFNKAYSKYNVAPLSNLTSDITDGDHMPPPKSAVGVPFITIKNIDKRTRKIDLDNTFRVPPDYFYGLKHNRKPRKGDVLYTVTGSYGIPVVIDHDKAFCFQRHIGLIRPLNCLDSKWLYYLLISPQITSQADEQATGTAQKTVSLKALRGFQVPEVPLGEQHDNVVGLNEISAETSRLEYIYQQKLTALAELKQSLLQRAFSGELTARKEAPSKTLKEQEVA
jgi:type I restriction enzyme S subunit